MIPRTRREIEALPLHKTQVVGNYAFTPVLDGAFTLVMYTHDESLTGAISNNGFWESWVTAWHVNNVSEGDIYLDLGASSGYYSFLADNLGATVWAFEPNPDYVSVLYEARILNKAQVSIIKRAVSNEDDQAVRLNFFGNLDGSASIVGEGWGNNGIDVWTTKLDSWEFPTGQMIVKMDIEGAEELAWDGMTNLLATRKPTVIMEYTPGSYSEDFWKKMTGYGKVSILDYEGRENLVTEKYAESQTDWLTLVVRPR